MVLRKIADHICCTDCDQVFDKWHLNEGGQCPNTACPSNARTAIGTVMKQIGLLNAQRRPNRAVIRALSGLLPMRADTDDAQDEAVLQSLRELSDACIALSLSRIETNHNLELSLETPVGPVVTSDPDTLGGALCFGGTRVPVSVLFSSLADGMPLGEIVDAYPSLTLDHTRKVLEAAHHALANSANC